MQRQIADLEEAIANQDKQITTLKSELRDTSTLKQELEEAKHLILQMSQQQPEPSQPAAPKAAAPAPAPAPPAKKTLPRPLPSPPEAEPEFAGHSPMPTSRSQPRTVSDLVPSSGQQGGALRRRVSVDANAELWRVLEHPVAVELPATQFSDDDIGWVD
ncbi:MAG: hypothetical protein AAFY26_10555 [Cyanobacteria bacterium J06638_22]